MSEISIAIADDNLQTLSLLNDILEGEEDFHVVGKADNGEDAYNMIVKTSPDVVLLDVIMPRMDGITAVSYTHLMCIRDRSNRGSRIIFLSCRGIVVEHITI